MASIINVDKVRATGSTTDGVTVDSSGIVDMPNTVMYDTYRLHTNVTANGVITDWEQPDNTMMATVGDSMSVSSGIFTFPRTGIYRVFYTAVINNASGDNTTTAELFGTTDNSTYERLTYHWDGGTGSVTNYGTSSGEVVVNISDTANRKVKLEAGSLTSPSQIIGNSTYNSTYICFQYLAPAV